MIRNITYFVAVAIILIMNAGATTLDSSGSSPHKIFKCQPSVITANFTGYTGDVRVNLTHTNNMFPKESFVMVNLGSGQYAYTYGNDNTTTWGNKSLSFYRVSDIAENLSSSYVFVYSDDCTGSNILGYQNTTYRQTGFGNNTRLLFTGQENLLQFSVHPFLTYFGESIYLLFLFVLCMVLYVKNQSVMTPIIMGFIGIATLVSTGLISQGNFGGEFKIYILLFISLATAAIFWKLFKSA